MCPVLYQKTHLTARRQMQRRVRPYVRSRTSSQPVTAEASSEVGASAMKSPPDLTTPRSATLRSVSEKPRASPSAYGGYDVTVKRRFERVRRIGERNRKTRPGIRGEIAVCVRADHRARTCRNAALLCRRDVLPQHRGMAAVALDERSGLGAPRKSLQPDSAGTCEQVQKVTARNLVPDYVEHRLAHAILRRTYVARTGRLHDHAAESSAGNPHRHISETRTDADFGSSMSSSALSAGFSSKFTPRHSYAPSLVAVSSVMS